MAPLRRHICFGVDLMLVMAGPVVSVIHVFLARGAKDVDDSHFTETSFVAIVVSIVCEVIKVSRFKSVEATDRPDAPVLRRSL